MWVEFVVGSLLCSERFFSGYSSFPLSWKTNISKFQFDQESGERRTTLWMCYLQIIYLFIYFLTSSSPFHVIVTSICGCRVCWDNQCDWSQYSQHLRNISCAGSVLLANYPPTPPLSFWGEETDDISDYPQSPCRRFGVRAKRWMPFKTTILHNVPGSFPSRHEKLFGII